MAFCRIKTKGFTHFWVRFLVSTNPIRRMFIQCRFEVALVELFEELDVIRKEIFIPPAEFSAARVIAHTILTYNPSSQLRSGAVF